MTGTDGNVSKFDPCEVLARINAISSMTWRYEWKRIASSPPIQDALAASDEDQVALLKLILAQIGSLQEVIEGDSNAWMRYMNVFQEDGFPRAGATLFRQLIRKSSLRVTVEDLNEMVSSLARLSLVCTWCVPAVDLFKRVRKGVEEHGLTDDLRQSLSRLITSLSHDSRAEPRRLIKEIELLLVGDGAYPFERGEAWADDAAAHLESMKKPERSAVVGVLAHGTTLSGGSPTQKWLMQAKQLVKQVGEVRLVRFAERAFAQLDRPRTAVVEQWAEWIPDPNRMWSDVNMDVLKGLAWSLSIASANESAAVCRLLSRLAISAYRKVPKIGPRAVRVGNAALGALSSISNEDAVGQLAMLKVRVKFGTAQKQIEKAFNLAAVNLGMPRDQIEELAVPAYGLEDVGKAVETLGDYHAELLIDGIDASVKWFDAAGKALKSVPAKVKSEQKDELKELQQSVKDIAAMLPAQRDRIDSLFLMQKKWPAAVWRERYLDHPLVGTIARRLIWVIDDGTQQKPAMWLANQLAGVDDSPIELADTAQIELWHPIGRTMDEVLAWRAWLQRHEVRQPFKQAHREIYVLTDAERRTNTYSNRFASHVLRQHQFNALCAVRGWKNKLRLMVDDEYPPATRELPLWGLRAEYWVEGAGDDYGTDTTESGAFLRVATDQVRFYRTGAVVNYAHAGGGSYTTAAVDEGPGRVNEPLPLDQIPPLVFSEIMRDVDLFVGVASVGNDPTWQDGGPEGRYRAYWQSYSFGELGETAKTRRDVLASLLPRLTKLKGKWSLEEKFLVVRGSLRTYKIHLGSGNILMEPNDQYLCIVASRSTKQSESLFLPFEGDGTLSIIVSKAFLLAEDEKIKDETITRQIAR